MRQQELEFLGIIKKPNDPNDPNSDEYKLRVNREEVKKK